MVDSQLVGRDIEVARVDAIIEGLPERGAALVVSGEPGVGKSALLQYARARADALGLRTLTAVGVESEAELAFAGVHQLLHPILGLLKLLPAPGAALRGFGGRARAARVWLRISRPIRTNNVTSPASRTAATRAVIGSDHNSIMGFLDSPPNLSRAGRP